MRAKEACAELARLGVRVKLIGSILGERFGPHSDIDFLVLDCPRDLKYAIEGKVEDILGGFPFDVVYAEEIPEYKRDRFISGAVDAERLS